jgi:flagellar motility protein MotE (MotC chaperone)
MMKYLQSGWFAMMAGALVYLGVTVALIGRSPALKGGVPSGTSEDFPGAGPAWEFVNPELDRLITELKKEKEALTQRELQLKELAARLDAERTELNIVTQAVHRMRSEMEKDVVRVREEETANLKRLAKMYASMSPEGAAAILKQMEDEQALKFMVFMKDAESGPLLEAFGRMGEAEAKRAATLTDRLRTTVYRSAVATPPQ